MKYRIVKIYRASPVPGEYYKAQYEVYKKRFKVVGHKIVIIDIPKWKDVPFSFNSDKQFAEEAIRKHKMEMLYKDKQPEIIHVISEDK